MKKTQAVTSKYNRRGGLESYTDASGDIATYTYNEDGQVAKVKDGSDEGKGEQTYTYSEETGELAELVDAGAGTFTAGYDAQGEMTSVGYPNGMTASYTYNPVGGATTLEYKKVTHCTENCVWFKDSVTPSIHGEALSQNSTLAGEEYAYDNAGRLTQVQETPSGEGCTTRAYTYSEDSDRTKLATSKPGSEGKCSGENPVVEAHTYDSADQMTDEGTTYEAFGNTTKLPAGDAGGHAITSEYYVDGQAYKQTQNGQTSEYKLDPEDRILETKASSTITDHYDAPGNGIAWTSEPGKWERRIPGIEGGLAAIQTGTTKANVILQLHDLQGNIVATVEDSETATKLATTYNSTEFGAPNSKGEPPKFAYQGASGITSESSTGRIVQDGITYVPQTGAMLQPPEDLSPGIPTNHNAAYVSNPNNTTAGEFAARTSAEQVSHREQEIVEREEAKRPAGSAPSPRATIGGTGEEEGDGGATIASVANCVVHWELDETEDGSGFMYALGSFQCKRSVEIFRLQFCGYVSETSGAGKQFYCLVSPYKKWVGFSNTTGGGVEATYVCGAGYYYTAWVWGEEYSDGTRRAYPNSSIYNPQHEWMQCHGQSADSVVQSMETW